MTAGTRILVVEDEVIVREDLRDLLEGLGYVVAGAAVAGREAIAKAQELEPDLVLMDIQLKDDMDGVDAAREVRGQFGIPVVFLTAFVDERTIARAAAACPYGYIVKPFNVRAIRASIEVALHRHRNERRPAGAGDETDGDSVGSDDLFHGLVGRCEAMRDLYERIRQLAPLKTTVLIEGETGTGKERVARAIHAAGPRAGRPFVTVNCAGLTETLAASELFGHRRGAFTGAAHDHKGFFEAADSGTVFLDEIGDVPRGQQPLLLRVLEEREVTRVGENAPRSIDVRVLAASNRQLDDEVVAGRFRSDLFYRVRVARIRVPPLRERNEDVPLLADHFLTKFGSSDGMAAVALSPDALQRLRAYGWPGNVRELRNTMEFAAIGCVGGVIHASDLPPEIQALASKRPEAPPTPDEEMALLLAALERAQGNRSEAARLLGISRATFYRRLADAGLPSDRSSI